MASKKNNKNNSSDDNLENNKNNKKNKKNKKYDDKFEYYDFDDNKMYTMYLENSSEAPIKIGKVADYYELFVRMLKTNLKICILMNTFGY